MSSGGGGGGGGSPSTYVLRVHMKNMGGRQAEKSKHTEYTEGHRPNQDESYKQ